MLSLMDGAGREGKGEQAESAAETKAERKAPGKQTRAAQLPIQRSGAGPASSGDASKPTSGVAGDSSARSAASDRTNANWNECFRVQLDNGNHVQRKETGGQATGPASALERASTSVGAPLPGGVRGSLEKTTGASLGDVKVHTGSESAAAADGLAARAFTTGQDVHFAGGQYSPDTAKGQRLIAHEVAHTIQQRGAASAPQTKLTVSEPGDSLEREADQVADAHARGEVAPSLSSAGSGTVQREGLIDVVNDHFDTMGGPKLVTFLEAIKNADKAAAVTAWAAVPAGARHFLKYPNLLRKMGKYPAGLASDPIPPIIRVMGPASLRVLTAADITIGKKDSYVLLVLTDTANASAWMTALNADFTQLISFMLSLPDKTDITSVQVKNLAKFVDHMTGIWSKFVFQRVYPKLHDTTYKTTLVTRAWNATDVKKMFNGLSANVPVAHVHTIARGFYLGVTSKGKRLGYGWYNSKGRVVMPAGGATATKAAYTGTSTTHGMSGGASATTGRKLDHFNSTLLHEIGHGVGAHTDGNSWARKWGDWKKHGSDSWSKKLFSDSAMGAVATTLESSGTLPIRNILPPSDARKWLAAKIAGRTPSTVYTMKPGDWLSIRKWTDTQIENFINAHYATEKLTKYFKRGLKPESAYKVNANNLGSDGRVYMFLEVWDDSHCSYKAKVYNNKVSSYSLCSSGEWFAEQYTEYYRTNKVAGTLPPTVKAKFDKLDKMKWDGVRDELKDPGAADDDTPMKQYTDEEKVLNWVWWR
jgi:hypothetical protein